MILAAYRAPFSQAAPEVRWHDRPVSLAEMLAAMPGLERFDGEICIDGHLVPRAMWAHVRPKPDAARPVEVTFHAPIRGRSVRRVFAVVAGVVLAVATGFIAAGGLAGVFGGGFAAGTLGANLAAAGVALAGSLLLGALSPPPLLAERQKEGRTQESRRNASAQGNLLEPNGPIPRIVGERRVFPPFAAEPLITFDGPDEVVEAVFALAGPHRLRDIRVGEAPIEDLPGVEVQLREGWPGQFPLSLVRRHSRTEQVGTELRGHLVSDSDGTTLDTTAGDLATAVPQPQVVTTRKAPDEHQIQIAFPQGLHRPVSEDDLLRIPFRLRMRRRGDAEWRVLPEMHWQAANPRQMRATIRLIWREDASVSPGASGVEGWVEARIAAPGQTDQPEQPDFAADEWFDGGSGEAWLTQLTLGSTAVRHVSLGRYEAQIYLGTADWPPGTYEVEIVRGCAIRSTNYSTANYTVSGNVRDLFGYFGTPARIPQTRDGLVDTVSVQRSVSIWNRRPVKGDRCALIAVRARNKELDRVSVRAGGWVRDWDGTGWHDWAVTDNPAPHLRDIFTGRENFDPVPPAIVDDDELVEWRARCAAEGWRCNALIDGSSVQEAATIVAACGFGRPRMADTWGVVQDYDSSAEPPLQFFTPRNIADFSWRKAFPRLPEAFRVNFDAEDDEYQQRQLVVNRPGFLGAPRLPEQVTYEGLVTEEEVRRRARYDLAQLELRASFYQFTAPPEAVMVRRGDLVALQNDVLSEIGASQRVAHVEFAGDDAAALVLDAPVPVQNEPDVLAVGDFLAVPDVLALGAVPAVALRLADGSSSVHDLANATGSTDRLEFAAPVAAAGLRRGVLAMVGRKGNETRRCRVFEMEPAEDLNWRITCVDEAPELFA